jgi:LysM repeat protein
LYIHLPVTSGASGTQVASQRSGKSKGHAGVQTASSRTTFGTKSGTKSATKSTNSGTASAGMIHHKVKAGETLYSIASSYNTTVTALKHDNRNLAALRPGMILIVHNPR